MKLRTGQQAKTKISSTLAGWLPLLQAPLADLEAELRAIVADNPFCTVEAGNMQSLDATENGDYEEQDEDDERYASYEKSSNRDTIEALTVSEESLFDHLYAQIDSALFPTPRSRQIAHAIVNAINDEGFFEGDTAQIARTCGVTPREVEAVRRRFCYLTPSGVGAVDLAEAMLFQLDDAGVDDELDALLRRMIGAMDHMGTLSSHPRFAEAMGVMRRFKNPPAVDFLEDSAQVIPDIFIHDDEGDLVVVLNDAFYPQIVIESPEGSHGDPFVKPRIKEAKDLVDALMMRRQTLYKLALMIVEYQYDFFRGGEIRPMRLVDLSQELGRNPSTISRAIAGKYIACSRGVIPMKSFFSTALDEDLSSNTIKEFVRRVIKGEERDAVLSDEKILELIEEKFKIKIVRRTITKYRKEMDIPSSSERRKLYAIGAGL